MPATQGDAEVVLELADLVATEPLGPRFETALADKTDPLKLIRRGTVEATFFSVAVTQAGRGILVRNGCR